MSKAVLFGYLVVIVATIAQAPANYSRETKIKELKLALQTENNQKRA